MNYNSFIQDKVKRFDSMGFDIDIESINTDMFEWQKIITRFSLHNGRGGLFEECGLGKTLQELELALKCSEKTGKPSLIYAPLAVNKQTIKEGVKFGYEVNPCRNMDEIKSGINISNYEMMQHFDYSQIGCVVLDEADILQSFMGKYKQYLVDNCKHIPYRFTATATPASNSHMEILNQAEFLGIMTSNEALARWFINDTMAMGNYRLKDHAKKDFSKWLSSWSVFLKKPSDIGFSDEGYATPGVETYEHIIDYKEQFDIEKGLLFKGQEKINATQLYRELRETAQERCEFAAELVKNDSEQWAVWCNTNHESELLKKLIGEDCVEVKGSMPIDKKEDYIDAFSEGKARIIITKPSICGFGLNWQDKHKTCAVGMNFSFKQRYQYLKRFDRFGQTKKVQDHVVLSPAEKQIYDRVNQKGINHDELMSFIRNDIDSLQNPKSKTKLTMSYKKKEYSGQNYKIIVGDSCQEIQNIPDNSIHFNIFSPPFSNLYIYSDSAFDMGNCDNDETFFKQFDFLIPELYRITMPGRLCAVHCKQLVDYKGRDGRAGLRDFRGEIIRHFEKHNWKYHSEVCIWIDPVLEMQRTKANGLLHKTIKRDSSFSRQGMPEYLVVFRKWAEEGENTIPVERPLGFQDYIGNDDSIQLSDIDILKTMEEKAKQDNDKKKVKNIKKEIVHAQTGNSINIWQRYASPVWWDINRTDVLNHRIARSDQDEKHIAPLQLSVIKRAIHLWTLPGETIFTPFCGIGSEIYGANEINRKGIGIELKPEYAVHADKFLNTLENKHKQLSFDFS